MQLGRKRRMKGQIRLTETIAILFIFFLLVALGISFYAKYSKVAFQEREEELLQNRAVKATLKALFLPEALCSRGEAEPEENCIDMMKVRHMQERLEPEFNGSYFELFSFANITAHQIYPEEGKWVLYINPKPHIENSERTYFVVAMRDDVAGDKGVPSYGFGYVAVEVYS